MNLLRFFYYVLFLLSGGYRHYSFEYLFLSKMQGDSFNLVIYDTIQLAEIAIFSAVLFSLIFSRIVWFDFVVWLLIFVVDLFFQNFVKFESSVILTHSIPLFFYLQRRGCFDSGLFYSAILFVSVGFISSGFQKILSGWFNLTDFALLSYLVEFNEGYGFYPLLGSFLLKNELPSFMWKVADILVVLFQISFLRFFWGTSKFYLWLLAASVFHVLNIWILGISVFFPYILFYIFILFVFKPSIISRGIDVFFQRIQFPIGILCLIFFILAGFDCHFFYQNSSLFFYMYSDYFFNYILFSCHLFFTLKLWFSLKNDSLSHI